MIEVDLYKCRKSFKSFPMNAQSGVCIFFLRAFDMLIYIYHPIWFPFYIHFIFHYVMQYTFPCV